MTGDNTAGGIDKKREAKDDSALPHQGDEIEITDAMIEAGFAELKLSALADDYLEADKHTVVGIFLAMWRAKFAERKA